MEEIIRIEHMTKRFKQQTLLEAVNLSIYKGQSVVFTGKNGSGKSTLLRILSGLTRETTGTIHRNKDLLIHYIPEHFPRKKLSAYQYLQLVGKIDGCTQAEAESKIQLLAEEFFISDMLHTPLQFLSKGSLQKIGVIQALIQEPDILLLDEPLSGQDQRSQQVFITKMKQLLKKEVTIIMSCHEKHLIRAISDTAYHIENRQVQPIAVSSFHTEATFLLTFIDEENQAVLPDTAFIVEQSENQVQLSVPASQTNQLIKIMLDNQWTLRRMQHEDDQ